MLFVALAIRVNFPGFSGFHGNVHWIHEYLPISLPSWAPLQVFPPSTETITSLILYPPEKAIPIIVTGRFTFKDDALAGSIIRDLVVIRLIGIDFFCAEPGGIQPQGVSGIR